MSINRSILEKLTAKTKDDKYLKDFITTLLLKENEGIGWFKQYYRDLLALFCKEGNEE